MTAHQKEFCNNYSVTITRMWPFNHTRPLALSTTWAGISAKKSDHWSLKNTAESHPFAFCALAACSLSMYRLIRTTAPILLP
jgi:hypothetical protein